MATNSRKNEGRETSRNSLKFGKNYKSDKIRQIKFSDYDKKVIINYMIDFIRESDEFQNIKNDEERKWVLSVEIISTFIQIKLHRHPVLVMFEKEFQTTIDNEIYDELCNFSFGDLCRKFSDLNHIVKILMKNL